MDLEYDETYLHDSVIVDKIKSPLEWSSTVEPRCCFRWSGTPYIVWPLPRRGATSLVLLWTIIRSLTVTNSLQHRPADGILSSCGDLAQSFAMGKFRYGSSSLIGLVSVAQLLTAYNINSPQYLVATQFWLCLVGFMHSLHWAISSGYWHHCCRWSCVIFIPVLQDQNTGRNFINNNLLF